MYSEEFYKIAHELKERAGWHCTTCNHKHDPENGYTLTVHHLDGDKDNNEEYNLATLCQRCHLRYQSKLYRTVKNQLALFGK